MYVCMCVCAKHIVVVFCFICGVSVHICCDCLFLTAFVRCVKAIITYFITCILDNNITTKPETS